MSWFLLAISVAVSQVRERGDRALARGDLVEARACFRACRMAGDLDAEFKLGLTMLDCPRDDAPPPAKCALPPWKRPSERRMGPGIEHITRAALRGHPGAAYWLGRYHAAKHDGKQARRWYRRAAARGSSEAQHALALALARDRNDASRSRAFRWCLRAAESGLAPAQYRVGVWYDLGFGVEANPAHAAQWLRRAAAQNHVDSHRELAVRYRSGDGVARSHVQAFAHEVQAAHLGDRAAKNRAAALLHRLSAKDRKAALEAARVLMAGSG